MLVRITSLVLSIVGTLALLLGIIIWIGLVQAGALYTVHMICGIIVVLSLWLLGGVIGFSGNRNFGLGILAILLGLVVLIFGMAQGSIIPDPGLHWITRVIHLLLGICAVAVGQVIAGRQRRPSRPASSVS